MANQSRIERWRARDGELLMALIRDLSDADLIKEFSEWSRQIKSTTSWGAALAAAVEFRRGCKTELLRRGIKLPE
jgi:hypothetical protein